MNHTAAIPEPAEIVSRTASAPTGRVLSIDVLRGITIAFMILVNDAGDSRHTFVQLEHAPWNGVTLTDLVFPSFLFIVGASIILSLSGRAARGATRAQLALRVVRRSVTIFLVAMLLNLIPYFHFTHLRLYGVLTRIALCYLAAGLLCLVTRRARTLLLITAALLVGYWILMRFVHVPGFGVPTRDIPLLDPDRNLAAWLDRGIMGWFQAHLHTGVLYEHTRDPEGFLSTFPAIATTLLGCVSALWLRGEIRAGKPGSFPATQSQTAIGLLFGGLLSIALGLAWNLSFPINKRLWTSSYVLFAAGCSLLGLALFYWLIDIRRIDKTKWGAALLRPWLIFGTNAIAAYACSVLFIKALIDIHTGNTLPNGRPQSLLGWIYPQVFAPHGSTNWTSAAFALAFTALCFLPIWLLWRKRIFLKL